ncbi:MAG TPA: ABC transporter substrate-binding protein [Methylomirabilota bacterium]|nr:ABC transporter substrate-binding protein [Methylomirabilota bacterium]
MTMLLETPPRQSPMPVPSGQPKDALREAVRDLLGSREPAAADALFDVPVIARRCLGRHWPERTPEERQDFSAALGPLLVTALREPLTAATGLRYTGQSASGPLVSVRVELTRERGTAGLLELRVHRVHDRWLINDFVVDGESFVAQHRARIDRRFSR